MPEKPTAIDTTSSYSVGKYVCSALVRNDAGKMRWLLHRRPVAGHAKVADSAHGDLSIAPILSSNPFNGIIAIFTYGQSAE